MGNTKLVAIDLFAGAGGLSYGFEMTGLIETKVAVEINKYAQKTFRQNHPCAQVLSDITKVNYAKIVERHGSVDLVIGGPPCQGFSNANRQKNSLISNNNQLIKDFVKSIERLRPKAFVMENVKAMSFKVHKFFVTTRDKQGLADIGVDVSEESFTIGYVTEISGDLLELVNTGVDVRPYTLSDTAFSKFNAIRRTFTQSGRTEEYLGKQRDTLAKLLSQWGELHRGYWGIRYRKMWFELGDQLKRWYAEQGEIDDSFRRKVNIVVETQKILRKLSETRQHDVDVLDTYIKNGNVMIKVQTYKVLDYVLKRLHSLGYEISHGVLNSAWFGVPQTRERLFLVGVRRDALNGRSMRLPQAVLRSPSKFHTIGDAIMDLEIVAPSTKTHAAPVDVCPYDGNNPIQKYLRDSNKLHNHVTTDSTEIARARFSKLVPWQNFHDLDESSKLSYSDAARTQNTIYLRLDYTKVSKSVCNVRKSMWIHPVVDRAVSIREAARLQSFPDSYVFHGSKDAQYQQIGNAVPPLLARAVAEQVLRLLGIEVPDSLSRILSPAFRYPPPHDASGFVREEKALVAWPG